MVRFIKIFVTELTSIVLSGSLKGPCNPNACRPLLNCIDLYVTYLTIWEYEFVSYILQEFFNYFSFSCYAPPLKNLPNSDSLDDIISQTSVSWTKDTDICLPTKWNLDYNGSACFPMIGHHSLFFFVIFLEHSWHSKCSLHNTSLGNAIAWKSNAIVNRLLIEGRDIPLC